LINHLAIFVGGKVTKSISKETASDVVEVLKFLEAFVKNDGQSIETHQIIVGSQGRFEQRNGSFHISGMHFKEIRKSGRTAKTVFLDVLKEVFNSDVAGASLHIDNLKGQVGEIGLRIGNADYFGVINVGDDKGLLKDLRSSQNAGG
jgi:hypothetical protein